MPHPDLERIFERVRKLLALSKSDNVNEAAAALSQASRLIHEHNLEQAEIELGGGDAETIGQADPLFEGKSEGWEERLASCISRHFGVAVVDHRVGRHHSYVLFGRPSDVRAVRVTFAWVRGEIRHLAAAHGRGQGRAWMNSFRHGAVSAVRDMLAESQAEAQAAASAAGRGGAAVVLASRYDAADAFMKSAIPRVGTAKQRTAGTSPDGFQAGVAAGQAIDVLGERSPRLSV